MANVLVEESCLSGIASAIRSQMYYTNTPYYKPSEMASGINDLKAKVAWSLLVNPSTNNTSSLIGSTTFYSSTYYPQLAPLAFCGRFSATINTIDLPNIVECQYHTHIISNNTMYIGGQFWGLNNISSIFLSSYVSWRIPGFLFAECSKLSDLRIGSSSHFYTNIGEYAFFGCSSLSEIPSNILMSAGTIGSYAFASCSNITNINNLNPSYINEYAFKNCSKITSISLTNCVSISSFAFAYCSNLTSIYLPNLSSLADYAFTGCNLTGNIELTKVNPYQFGSNKIQNYATATNRFTLSLPICSSIYLPNYSWCTKLWAPVAASVNINGSSCYISEIYANSTSLYLSASGNISLVKVSIPNASAISASAFFGCTNLSDITATAVTTVYSSAFKSCYNLSILSLPSASVIYPLAFSYCSKLVSLYLMGSSVCKLSGTAVSTFTGCPIYDSTVNNNVYGSIYVPSSLYNTYKASTNWVAISSRFVSM